MDFGQALVELKKGSWLARAGWNGKGMWIALGSPAQYPMTRPYLYMRTVDAHYVPWTASQTDILAEDWEKVTPDGSR